VIKIWFILSLAVVLGSGCGPGVHMTYLDTSPDSEDTGEIGSAYEDVDGLVDCLNGAFIRLPRTSEDVNDTFDVWTYNELRTIAYGDADADRGFGGFFPVTFVAEDDPIDWAEGWYVSGTVDTNYDHGESVRVEYYQYPDRTEETQSFTLVCPGKDW
jgi:hypothetical protein